MDKKILIAAVAATIVALIGGYMYAQKKQDEKSISLKIGGKEISATIE